MEQQRAYRKAGLPKKHWRQSLDDYVVSATGFGDPTARNRVEEYLSGLDSHLQDGEGLLLFGPPGTGKTMLASIVGREAIDKGFHVLYFRLASFGEALMRMLDLKDAWKVMEDEEAYRAWQRIDHQMQESREIDFLIVDDVGKEHVSASRYIEDSFDLLLRARRDRLLPTILTSNIGEPSEWAQRYSTSMASFIHEAVWRVPVVAEDFRRR